MPESDEANTRNERVGSRLTKMRSAVVNSFREEFRGECFWFKCEAWHFLILQWEHGDKPERRDRRRLAHITLYRLFMMLYVIAWFIGDLVVNEDPYYITFLTHWGQIVMVFYFVFSFCVVFMEFVKYVWKHAEDTPHDVYDDTMRWYHIVTWILLNIYVTVSYIITVSYWVGVSFDLITPAKSEPSVNYHVHVVNSILATIELMVTDLQVRILHFYCPIAFGVIYLIFTLILHGSGDLSAVYAVLNWMDNPGTAVGYALGILFIAVPIFHTVVWSITKLRVFLHHHYVAWSSRCCRSTSGSYDFNTDARNHGSLNRTAGDVEPKIGVTGV